MLLELIAPAIHDADKKSLAQLMDDLREQVDIDSFDFLNAVICLHEKLGVDIPEADYGQLATLDGTVDYLAKKCGSAV